MSQSFLLSYYLRICLCLILILSFGITNAQSTRTVEENVAIAEKNKKNGDIKEATRFLNDAAIM
jgi:hypothetical protein